MRRKHQRKRKPTSAYLQRLGGFVLLTCLSAVVASTLLHAATLILGYNPVHTP